MQYLDGDMPLPDLSETYISFAMLERMYGREFEFNQNLMSCMSMTSVGDISDLSGGR
jgi:hypothetical protein